MAVEIERRFRVNGDAWRGLAEGVRYRQGYLSVEKERTVRVRVVGDQAWLTLKGQISDISRHEFEYTIPVAEAQTIMDAMCPMVVDKLRYRIEMGGFVWEVDEFFGENEGLVVAEVELGSEDEAFERPDFLGKEVTGDRRYYNSSLRIRPYSQWEKE